MKLSETEFSVKGIVETSLPQTPLGNPFIIEFKT